MCRMGLVNPRGILVSLISTTQVDDSHLLCYHPFNEVIELCVFDIKSCNSFFLVYFFSSVCYSIIPVVTGSFFPSNISFLHKDSSVCCSAIAEFL